MTTLWTGINAFYAHWHIQVLHIGWDNFAGIALQYKRVQYLQPSRYLSLAFPIHHIVVRLDRRGQCRLQSLLYPP